MKALLRTLAVTTALSTFAFADEKPNILLICVNDLKPALGCYGDTTAITPAIDAFAKRATLFERAYCNQAVCGPARNALITGLRPDTLGLYKITTFFRKSIRDVVTLPQTFKQAGYQTSSLGKVMHVSYRNTDDGVSWSVPSWTPKAEKYALAESKENSRETAKGERYAVTECADVPDETYEDGLIAVGK